MFSSFWPGRAFRRSLAMALGAACAMALPAAQAAPADQTATLQAPTWAQAVEDAWLRSPAGRAWGLRQAQAQAGRDAASSWLADAPALTLLERNDRWHDRRGQREWEAELDLPLRLPGMRHALQATALAQAEAAQARGAADRLAVAGEVREAGWALRLAGIDVEAARLRVDEAQALARDVARRVSAGDLARVDAHRAQAAVHQAQAALARAEAALLRARSAFQALTGHADAPLEDEPPAGGEAVQGFALDAVAQPAPAGALADHPQAMAARLAARQAQADLALTEADRRDAPALIVGLTRERDGFDAPSATTTRLGLRWPLAADVRNAPRAAAARAELAQAEGQADALLARLAAEAQAARAEHAQALQLRQLARAQAALAEQAQQLIRRAFDLGEANLPTRLAADAEHQQARLDARRAELEAGRAQSRLRQALGLLPGASATPASASPATSAPRPTRASSSEAAQP